uniref:ABC transmembrane type-2 domain-containing protein n=1 Tax=Antithamnionella ternifolia TaxID=207919 RepID=A0A4D6WP00_9FLOR|nr:hypothetical protein [Antithamnionella ternifolia]
MNSYIKNKSKKSYIIPKQLISTNIPYLQIIYEIYALTKRLYLQIIRKPSTFIASMIQPLLWLLLFGSLFQNIPINLFTNNIKYEIFLSPGIIVFTSFNGAVNAGLPLIFDREFGFLNRILISPLLLKDSLLISLLVSVITTTTLQTFTMLGFNILMMNRIPSYYFFITIIQIILLITISIASLSICLAFILPGHIEFLALLLLINLPTLFSSTALAPLSFMPYWLQILACLNPLTYAIEILRYVQSDITSIYYGSKILKTVWFTFSVYESMAVLILMTITNSMLAKYIIKYKYE